MRTLSPKYATLIALIALIAVAPLFFPSTFYYRIGALIFINGLAVIGLVVLIGYAGQISLGHAGFFALGAYASAILTGTYDWPPAGALLAGAAGTGLLAFAVARPIMQGFHLWNVKRTYQELKAKGRADQERAEQQALVQ